MSSITAYHPRNIVRFARVRASTDRMRARTSWTREERPVDRDAHIYDSGNHRLSDHLPTDGPTNVCCFSSTTALRPCLTEYPCRQVGLRNGTGSRNLFQHASRTKPARTRNAEHGRWVFIGKCFKYHKCQRTRLSCLRRSSHW